MPPRKQPQSLVQLATKGTAKLILKISSKISKKLFAQVNCPHQVVQNTSTNVTFCLPCRNIDKISDAIFSTLAPILWDTVVAAVEGILNDPEYEDDPEDPRIIYSILVNAHLTTFNFPYFHMKGMKHKDEEKSRNLFWLEQIPKMTNIVKLDLSSNRVSGDTKNVVRAVGKHCTKLKDVKFRCGSKHLAEYLQLLGRCVELRSIKCTLETAWHGLDVLKSQEIAVISALELFPKLESIDVDTYSLGVALASMDPSKKLNLRYFKTRQCLTEQLRKVVDLCPKLQRIDLAIQEGNDFTEAFQLLSESSLEITELSIDHGYPIDDIENFIVNKGSHLQKLTIDSFVPYRIFQQIARTCTNLRELSVFEGGRSSPTPLANLPEQASLLTNLVKFDFSLDSSIRAYPGLLMMLLPVKSNITSLDMCRSENNLDRPMMEVLASSRLPNLSVLFSNQADGFSKKLLRAFYKRCPKLKKVEVLKIGIVDYLQYAKRIGREAKQNNLVFKISVEDYY